MVYKGKVLISSTCAEKSWGKNPQPHMKDVSILQIENYMDMVKKKKNLQKPTANIML